MNEAKVCPQCGFDTMKTYYHDNTWTTFGDETYALHKVRESPTVILTVDGWHCLMCRYTWPDSQSLKGSTNNE